MSGKYNDMFYNQVIDAINPMEELGGPELEDYIEIMDAVQEEVQTRLATATARLEAETKKKETADPLARDCPNCDGTGQID